MQKYVELILEGQGGPAPTPDGRANYVGVYTLDAGSVDEECSFHRTPEEALARYERLVANGYKVEVRP